MRVDPVNDARVAADDVAAAINVDEDGALDISVLTNDTDVDFAHEGDSLTVQSFDGVDNGTVTIINSATQLHYVPDADFFGIEAFTLHRSG